ncbi:MAG: Hsp20/alpha crystallin family protein [Patescibacteria group bacterium]
MNKDEKQFDLLEQFLEDNNDVFLKNIRNDSTDDWPDNLYRPLERAVPEIASEKDEGQLALDIFQQGDDIIVISAIAGIDPDKIDISIHNDILTIRGERKLTESVDEENYIYKECYWGRFSRSVILPCEVKADKISATIKNGILKIVMPKADPQKKIKVKVLDEQ